MSTAPGQSLIPYPWDERKKFNDSRRLISPVVKVTNVLMVLVTVLSPPSVLVWAWCRFGFRRYNDSWAKRGFITLVAGGLGVYFFSHGPMELLGAWDAVLRSFGPESNLDVRDSIVESMVLVFPWALLVHGVHALARSFQIERSTTAFLKEQRPTLYQRVRKARNVRQLSRGVDRHRRGGYVRFGVIEDDRIPWRRSRYGMVVERKIEKMGHGVFIGSNGTGKTKAAETFTHYVLQNDAAVIYIDFKASMSTMSGLSEVAENSGRPQYILDIGFGTDDMSWYDLFAWDGRPSDKASMLIECLQFPEGQQGAAYYRGIAEAWMPMQIEAAELLGLRDGEGMFDFLLDTAVPMKFRDRIAPLRDSSDPAVRERFEQWDADAGLVKAPDLSGLRNELTKITNAAGARLKPNPQNPKAVSMKEVMDNGGMVYIGIASGINDVVVKVLGSFLFKELSILVSARSRQDPRSLRDVFVIPDEASEMEERSVVMNPIYTMAREARVFIWPSFQSFASWEASTQKEIKANTQNYIAFKIPERETATAIGETIPDIFALSQMSAESTHQQAFQEQTIGISGDARLTVAVDSFLRPNIELSRVPLHHAYIWFQSERSVSRDRWWGRRRVKKDQNEGDAPLVNLVPYDLVMKQASEDDVHVRSDAPTVAEPVRLREESGADIEESSPAPESPAVVPSEVAGKSSDGWRAHVVEFEPDGEPPPEEEDLPPTSAAPGTEPSEGAGEVESAPAAPPPPLRFMGRAGSGEGPAFVSGGEGSSGEASSTRVSPASGGAIPLPEEDDEFTDDGAVVDAGPAGPGGALDDEQRESTERGETGDEHQDDDGGIAVTRGGDAEEGAGVHPQPDRDDSGEGLTVDSAPEGGEGKPPGGNSWLV